MSLKQALENDVRRDAEVFDSHGTLALQNDDYDVAYCRKPETLTGDQWQTVIVRIADAWKLPFSASDLTALLEVARHGFAMVQDEIAEEMDLPDAEMVRLREMLYAWLDKEEVKSDEG